jgi:hypothetical protein
MLTTTPLRPLLAGLLGVLLAGVVALGSLAAPASAADDPLLAPLGQCANDTNLAATEAAQRTAMYCLINHARTKSGRRALGYCTPTGVCNVVDGTYVKRLAASAQRKAYDVRVCPRPLPNYGHNACNRATNYWIAYYQYPARYWAENITFGTQWTARRAMAWWLQSAGHRATMLSTTYAELGVGMVKGYTPEGGSSSQVWVAHFGLR